MTTQIREMSNKNSIRKMLMDDNTSASVLLAILADEYLEDFLTWTPQAIRLELESEYDVEISDVLVGKIMAGIYLITTNGFYVSLPDFTDVCNALSGEPNTNGVYDPATATEIAWALTEMMILDPPDEDDEIFTEEILSYIGAMVDYEGMVNAPKILSIGTRQNTDTIMDRVKYNTEGDADLVAAVWQMDREKTEDVDRYVKTKLRRLIEDLAKLPLKEDSAKEFAKRLYNRLG